MNDFFSKLFHRGPEYAAPGKMDRAYVSEFTHFIDDFLVDHPEVVKDQHVGRLIYWEKKVDQLALEKAERDTVPDDGYGFYASAWEHDKNREQPAVVSAPVI